MDIAGLSMALANINLRNEVSIAILDKALENNSDFGDSLLRMMNHSMELSVNPDIGSNIDLYI